MNIISIKDNFKTYYNEEAALRNRSVKQDWKIKVREDFLRLILQENKKTLVEIGAGTGYDSQFFMNNGLQVVAVDISSEMVRKCKEKAIEAYELDFYNISSLYKKFDCIWAMNTLLHVPKTDLDQVLCEINLVLDENGLFYMGVYGGEDVENEFVKSEVSDVSRFFSFYSENRLKAALANHFEVIDFVQLDVDKGAAINTFQSVIMRKK